MHAAALKVELRLRGVRSLKEKRSIVKAVLSHLTSTYGVAAAEVDDQDKWQRCTLGIAGVSAHAGHLTRVLHTVERHLRGRDDVEVLHITSGHVEMME